MSKKASSTLLLLWAVALFIAMVLLFVAFFSIGWAPSRGSAPRRSSRCPGREYRSPGERVLRVGPSRRRFLLPDAKDCWRKEIEERKKGIIDISCIKNHVQVTCVRPRLRLTMEMDGGGEIERN
jgi:hypothetical protein